MRSYKKLGIITLIIFILLAFAVYKVNALILKQLEQVGTVETPVFEPPSQGNEEELERVYKAIEGIVIEGQSPPAVIKEKPPSAAIQSRKKEGAIYEPSSNDPILIQ